MKLNLNKTVKTIEGLEVKDEVIEGGKTVLKPITIAQMCARILFNSSDIEVNNKLKAHSLAIRLFESKGEINIDLDEIIIIKDAVKNLTPGIYGQVINALEKKDEK